MVDQDVMKGPQPKQETRSKSPRHEQESKLSKVKRILTNTLNCNNASTFDEAKANCKARKRKERQESVSSILQERKVIRSSSEERPSPNELKNDIRRVSSQEVISVPEQNDENYNKPPLKDSFIYDDCEHERRRSHERFSKPLTHKGRRSNSRKPKTKRFTKPKQYSGNEYEKAFTPYCSNETNDDTFEKTEHDINFLNLHKIDKDRSPSPVHTPVSPALDLTTLHEQIDCSEPIPSNTNRTITDDTETLPSLSVASNRLLSSPRNSIMITRRIYLDPDIPLNNVTLNKESTNPLELKLKQLTKQMKSLKKKIKKQEEEFEIHFGFKPSHADKLSDKSIKKLYAELSKVKKEYKQLKEDSGMTTPDTLNGHISTESFNEHKPTIQDTLSDIEKHLEIKRKCSERCSEMAKMTNEELCDEKIAVQKALLHLESIHGRPVTKEDRDLVRPLYDRYRNLKRLVARISLSQTSSNELATIHEDETMDFVSTTTTVTEIECEGSTSVAYSTDSDTDTSIGENLHSLSREELFEQQKIISEEKKHLRRTLKLFESEFQIKNFRKLQKEDKTPMENVYVAYKKCKAKLRLIDALLGKPTR